MFQILRVSVKLVLHYKGFSLNLYLLTPPHRSVHESFIIHRILPLMFDTPSFTLKFLLLMLVISPYPLFYISLC